MSTSTAEADPVSATLRWARPEDAAAIAELLDIANEGLFASTLAAQFPSRPWQDVLAEQIEAKSGEISHTNAIVVEVDGRVVGMRILYPLADPMPEIDLDAFPDDVRPFLALKGMVPGALYLRDMAVLPAMRGRGFGRMLVEAGLLVAERVESHRVCVIVHEANQKVLDLYGRRGFTVRASRPVGTHNAHPPDTCWNLLVKDLRPAQGEAQP